MPQLIFKGVKREDIKILSEKLPKILSLMSDTPMDYFTFECSISEYFFGGREVEMYPLIEIKQFDRGAQIEKRMADALKNEIKSLGYEECEVYFTHIERENYYE